MDWVDGYVKQRKPALFVEKKCREIKLRLEKVKPPSISQENKLLFIKEINFNKKLPFPRTSYDWAKRFELMRRIMMRLYANHQDNIELKGINAYLMIFAEYFEWVNVALSNKFYKTDDPVLNYATKLLRTEIELFINKYDFLLKSEDDVYLEDLNFGGNDAN